MRGTEKVEVKVRYIMVVDEAEHIENSFEEVVEEGQGWEERRS